VIDWLRQPSAMDVHFTPASASRLYAVEGFLAVLSKRRLKRGVFKGVLDLHRGHQVLDSIH